MRLDLILISALILAALASCQEQTSDPYWVKVEGGCFTMGEDPLYREEGPATETCVEPFELSSHEITNAQFARFVEASGYQTRAERGWRRDEAGGPGIDVPSGSMVFQLPEGGSQRPLDWWRFVEGANWRFPLGPDDAYRAADNAPVVHVTQEDAAAYVSWAGGRLPTEEEWEFAARARGEEGTATWSEIQEEARAGKANTWQGVFPARDLVVDGFANVAPVGSFPSNALGLFDMIGNVWEWTASPYTPTHSERDRRIASRRGFDPSQPSAQVATIKGGSYLCADNYCARFRPAARQAQDVALGTSHIGFRIARNAVEPR